MSYTEWSRVRVCALRAAFARDPDARAWDRGGIHSAIGIARHALGEEVAAGRKAGRGAPEVKSWGVV